MTKFEVTDSVVEAAIRAEMRSEKQWNSPEWVPSVAMRAAITAAIEASGLVERIAELEERLNHAHDTSWHFMGRNPLAAKYFLHICDILKPHVEDTTND